MSRVYLVLLLGLAACVRSEPLPPITGPAEQSIPIALKLPSYPSGAPVDLSKERGQVVMLDVWATWCEPCRDALPVSQDLLKQYEKRGLRVYAINADADAKQIPKFLAATKVHDLPILLDRDGQVAEHQLHVKVMPTAFLLDRRGVIRQVHEGFAEEFLQQYQNEIEQLLAEPAQ